MSDGPSSLRIGSLSVDGRDGRQSHNYIRETGSQMSNFLPRLVSPTALLYLYLIIMQIAQGIYFASEIEPSPAFTLIDSIGLLWLVGWWLLTDSRKRGVAWVYDMGFFLSIAWPLIIPYYLLKTRGAKGLLLILAFVITYIGAGVVGMALYLLVAPATG